MKKAERYFYPAVFTYEPGQEIAVVFPDLNCATSGINDDDALMSARKLLGCVLTIWRNTARRSLPYPVVRDRTPRQ